MNNSFRIALNQVNLKTGDINSNIENMKSGILMAQETGAEIVVFPELSLIGYAVNDLLKKRNFINDNINAMNEIIEFASRKVPVVIFGCADVKTSLYNSAIVASEGKIVGVCGKNNLELKGEFNESSYFCSDPRFNVFEIKGVRFGISVGGDVYKNVDLEHKFRRSGTGVIIDLDSPVYEMGKLQKIERDIASLSDRTGMCICQCNNVGGKDDLIFTGRSSVTDQFGNLIALGKAFDEDFLIADISPDFPFEIKKNGLGECFEETEIINITYHEEVKNEIYPKIAVQPGDIDEEIYQALRLSIKDYIKNNGFKGVILGLSGGIDSALVAALCVNAIGKENVLGLLMPSKYSSQGSVDDSLKLAENLGMRTMTISINDLFEKYVEVLNPEFSEIEMKNQNDTTEENIQARIRGNYLMAFSNKLGYLVMNTGNKSECATGYSTLYGDTVGGFAPISDLYKKYVYSLSKKINEIEGKEIIPVEIIDKEPSAELSPDQKDSDSLPEYETLDIILDLLIERDICTEAVISMGFDEVVVNKVNRLIRINEYKRRQEPLGPKISTCKFGTDRIYPITNGYKY